MAGFREFLTGEVLTAAAVNSFLMKQSVMVFADADARTAALGAEVAEGMLTYNEDTAQLEVFDGSAFIAAGSPGIGSNVVSEKVTADFSTSSGSGAAITGLTATITLTDATSRVLILVSSKAQRNSNANGFFVSALKRGATIVASTETRIAVANHNLPGPSYAVTETPGTVGPHTYTVEASNAGVAGTVTVFQPMFITVIEVAA